MNCQIREREDGKNSDTSPVPVSELVDDGSWQLEEAPIERGDSLYSEILEWLQAFRENLVDDGIPLQGDSHASSSHEASLEPIFKRCEDWEVSTVLKLISLKTEIARSVKGPKLPGGAKPYLVLKNLAT